MHLIVNCESLHPPRTGIGVYTGCLVSCWINSALVNSISGFSGARRLADAADLIDRPVASVLPGRGRLASTAHRIAGRWKWPYALFRADERRRFRRAAAGLGPEWLYFEPNFILKPFDGPGVAVVHDLSIVHFPKCHPAGRVRYLERRLPATLERAAHIITPSALVRSELMQRFGVPGDRVTAIHLGADARFGELSRDKVRDTLTRHNLTAGRYILSVATAEPRKNLVRLMQAYEALPSGLRKEYPLVLVGPEGWNDGDFAALKQKLERRGEVISLGYVPDRELPALYAGAGVFAYPSIYEGFGLPVLEAMRSGAAILTSRDTAMAEFAWQSVEYCDPFDVDSIRAGLEALLEDPRRRTALGESARMQARPLTWQRCADRHLEIFRRVMGEG